MKSSEYNQLVLNIVERTEKKLSEDIKSTYRQDGPNAAFAGLVISLPDTVAHLVSDILIQTGVLSLEEDDASSQSTD